MENGKEKVRQRSAVFASTQNVEGPITASKNVLERRLPFLVRRDGTWLYEGTPISRKEMLCFFASLISRDPLGRYWLSTPHERGLIDVEDVPFIACELDFRGECGRRQNLCLRTNVDEVLPIGAAHPLLVDWERPLFELAAPTPYVQVRKGDGDHPILARLSRPVYYELAALAVPGFVEGRSCMGVWSQDCFFPLAASFDD